MRALLAFLLAAVSLVLVPFADVGVWVQRELVGTSSFVRLGEDVLQQSAVRAALAQRIVTEMETRVPALTTQDSALPSLVDHALRSPQPRPAFARAPARTPDQLPNA